MRKPRGEGKWKLTRAQLQDSTENPADATLMASPRLGSDPVTRPLTDSQGLPADHTTKSEPPTLLLQALQLGPDPASQCSAPRMHSQNLWPGHALWQMQVHPGFSPQFLMLQCQLLGLTTRIWLL